MTSDLKDPWRRLLQLLGSDDESVDALTIIAELALEAIQENGLSRISMAGLQCQAVRPMPLATLLRTTYPWREAIKGWGEALELGQRLLIARGEDPADALYGLIKQ